MACAKLRTESSASRHFARCSLSGSSNLRRRSCQRCAAAKARCDLGRPQCSRCSTRKTTCEYANEFMSAQDDDIVSPPPIALLDNDGGTGQREHRLSPPDTNAGMPGRTLRLFDETPPGEKVSRSYVTPSSVPGPSCDEYPPSLEVTCGPLLPPQFIEDVPSENRAASPKFPPLADTLVERSIQAIVGEPRSQNLMAVPEMGPMRDRWLYPFLPTSKKACNPEKASVQMYAQILSTYPSMMAQGWGCLPPIIHPLQFSGAKELTPLSNCLSLSRMWQDRKPGSESLAKVTIRREMTRLFDEYQTYDEDDLLATMQALLLYAIMAYFSSDRTSPEPLVDAGTIMNMQQVSYCLATTGYILPAEETHTRPSWEEWIRASAKRRTIVVLYCFDCVYTTMNGLPMYQCDELRYFPAPAGKLLWQASPREQWERTYNRWLVRWQDRPSLLGDLMICRRRSVEESERLQKWIEEVDEFGMMLMIVVDGAVNAYAASISGAPRRLLQEGIATRDLT